MSIPSYLDEIKNIQKNLLDFFADEGSSEEKYQNLVDFLINFNIKENKKLLKETLHLISKISDNHHRLNNFIGKIEKILLFFTNEIHNYFSNFDIFNIFKHNKRILLFLLENKLLKIDERISKIIKTEKYKNYSIYFFNEMKEFIEKAEKEKIENQISIINEDDPNTFEQKRKIGENDKTICELIRNDSIEDFIVYVNRTNLSLSTTIENSIFETNSFLLKKKSNLIEYAAFFGSIQIFKYLYMNKNELLTSSLWLYAIHGNNPELIHLLEENNVKPNNNSYEECFIESIKCHHIDVSNYIQNNYLFQLKKDELKFIYPICFKFHNYVYFPSDINSSYLFELCRYDYISLVEILIKNTEVKSTITKIIFFLFILMQKFS